jgi:proton-dependent oligopeptide transporter, POT family
MDLFRIFRKFKSVFWASNIIELFERWAWYGFYMAFALYLVNSKDTGALGFSQAQKGIIMGTGSMLLYFLPLITGAIADKLGYKRMLFLAFALYASGYFMLMHFETFGYIFFAFLWTCTGGAFFKPIISAMIARNTDHETSSIGFGIFYMMVNIGGFAGPFLAGIVLNKSWDYVFYLSIGSILFNFLITAFFFREPVSGVQTIPVVRSIIHAFQNIGKTLINWKYLLFLVIMSIFWTAYNQLYYSFPVFVDQWADTGAIYRSIRGIWPGLASSIGTPEGTISAVTLSSMVSFFIILFQLAVSTFVMRFRPLSAMMGGIFVLSGGLFLMFSSQGGWLILLGILIFAVGEMASSPKFTEYIGRIAPEDQKALYMGTSFLPIAAGHQLGGWLSGGIFERISDKYYLLGKELTIRGVHVSEISDSFTKSDFWQNAMHQTGMSSGELSQYLWNTYHPGHIWHLFSGIALTAAVLLWIYNRFILGIPK